MKLLDEPPEVNDKPNAPILQVQDGEIEFGVSSLALFCYHDWLIVSCRER